MIKNQKAFFNIPQKKSAEIIEIEKINKLLNIKKSTSFTKENRAYIQKYLNEKNWDKLGAEIKKLLKLGCKTEFLLYYLGYSYLGLQKFNCAKSVLTLSRKIYPNSLIILSLYIDVLVIAFDNIDSSVLEIKKQDISKMDFNGSDLDKKKIISRMKKQTSGNIITSASWYHGKWSPHEKPNDDDPRIFIGDSKTSIDFGSLG